MALSSIEGSGLARKGLRVALGKNRRAMMAGVLMRASAAKAYWIIEGMMAVLVQNWEAVRDSKLRVGGLAHETRLKTPFWLKSLCRHPIKS